ncbi:Asp-tRNA(Asn)/Glu-tRNA(Gln) amidotransferase subunit GatB [Mycoplasma enhydrae]|uniref:Asp-tRNA(Asn)/Glu-tRNA(Gln) amidotransferase subunit GatB n=1 Tax=Mycoplasma enhydrae TaxID=2499220 RepID=UPI001F11AB99|nr:Asp-tRNA(Asn)/Glu-tRNA(Gln) amidotransferase subunit GatB [Mycoplasma enhydrae]
MNKWQLVIGIEIHLELNTKTKMFSAAPNLYTNEANINVSHIDLAYPGSLPLVNKEAIIKAIKLAKALNMEIDQKIRFDRKNYFYPDLTKGYQITQQFNPIGKNGIINIKVDDTWKQIAIERIHLEEDTAKSMHEGNLTYLNYNRAGVPLIEIVSKPVMHSAKEASAYVEAIRQTALALNISDAKMNEGSLRVDLNISLKQAADTKLGTKVEIKNLNSVSNVEKAINYEFQEQIKILENNQSVQQQTKRFDEASEKTVVMRSKSDSIDYKYFPDPNIPYIDLPKEIIDSIEIEELPFEREKRYISLGLNQVQISQLINNVAYANFVDSISTSDFKKNVNIFFSEFVSFLNSEQLDLNQLNLNQEDKNNFFQWILDGKINKKDIKLVLKKHIENPKQTLKSIIEINNLFIKTTNLSLDSIIQEIFNENPNLKDEFKNNPNRASKFTTGQVMKKTMGKANINELNQKMKELYEA